MTPENTYFDRRGYNCCAECRRQQTKRNYDDPGAAIPAERVSEWMFGWFATHPEVSEASLALRCGVSERLLFDLRFGNRKNIYLNSLDRILCAVGEPNLLGCFHSFVGAPLEPLPAAPKPRARSRRTSQCASGAGCPKRATKGHFCAAHAKELARIREELRVESLRLPSRKRKTAWNTRLGRTVPLNDDGYCIFDEEDMPTRRVAA
jgi:hypothetical protein